MTCPECSSVIPHLENTIIAEAQNSKTYAHDCMRCRALLQVTVTVIRKGNPESIIVYREYLKERKS